MSTVLVSGARTPIGKLLGALSTIPAPQLGGTAISAAVSRSGVGPEDIQAVLMGNVIQAGVGPNPARQAAFLGGLGMGIPSTTLNKLCLSGLTAIANADAFIRAGLYTTMVAGGMESMSLAPHLLRGARTGFKYGAGDLEDSIERDGLVDAFEDREIMGASTERHQRGMGFTREQLDAYAAQSHQRAAAAITGGVFDDEVVPVTVPSRKGDVEVTTDEGVRPETTVETLARLKPAFHPEGLITAGSASQLSDGAAAVVVMDRDEAERRGIPWLAEIVSYGTVAGPDASLLHQPANAIEHALSRTEGITVADLDVIELNEAFASVALASAQQLGVDLDRVNVNGGAIALGHPVGMSGARVALHVALELRRRGGGIGAAALCGGGGQGDALILRVP
jgi:acetyl-CoA C-acetyltransferase